MKFRPDKPVDDPTVVRKLGEIRDVLGGRKKLEETSISDITVPQITTNSMHAFKRWQDEQEADEIHQSDLN